MIVYSDQYRQRMNNDDGEECILRQIVVELEEVSMENAIRHAVLCYEIR